MKQDIRLEVLSEQTLNADTAGLADILLDCVHEGASVGFLDSIDPAQAQHYWQGVAQRAGKFELTVLAAFVDEKLAGTVQLILSPQPNQPHRADVAKLLVSPRFRRLGIASRLMRTVEELARELDRNLLVLDTLSGTGAEHLYFGLGWTKVGEIPRYALLPNGGEPLPTSIFYKDLREMTA